MFFIGMNAEWYGAEARGFGEWWRSRGRCAAAATPRGRPVALLRNAAGQQPAPLPSSRLRSHQILLQVGLFLSLLGIFCWDGFFPFHWMIRDFLFPFFFCATLSSLFFFFLASLWGGGWRGIGFGNLTTSRLHNPTGSQSTQHDFRPPPLPDRFWRTGFSHPVQPPGRPCGCWTLSPIWLGLSTLKPLVSATE